LALPPFFQQSILCRWRWQTGLGLDRSNRHLIRRWHREHGECAGYDIGEVNRMFLTSSYSGREVTNMGLHVALIGHAQGINVPQYLDKGNIACRTKWVTENRPDPRRIIINCPEMEGSRIAFAFAPSLSMLRVLSCIAPCTARSVWLLTPLAWPCFR